MPKVYASEWIMFHIRGNIDGMALFLRRHAIIFLRAKEYSLKKEKVIVMWLEILSEQKIRE